MMPLLNGALGLLAWSDYIDASLTGFPGSIPRVLAVQFSVHPTFISFRRGEPWLNTLFAIQRVEFLDCPSRVPRERHSDPLGRTPHSAKSLPALQFRYVNSLNHRGVIGIVRRRRRLLLFPTPVSRCGITCGCSPPAGWWVHHGTMSIIEP